MLPALVIISTLSGFGRVSACAQGENINPPLPPPTETTVETVFYFGDSHGAMIKPLLEQSWATHPEYSISLNLQGGTHFQDWHKAMAKLEAGSTVVIELGTNNALNEALNTGVLPENLQSTLDLLQSRGVARIIWPTINEYSAALKGPHVLTRVQYLNNTMRSIEAEGTYPLEVDDWNSVAEPQGQLILSEDNLHHNIEGNLQFTDFMVEAVLT